MKFKHDFYYITKNIHYERHTWTLCGDFEFKKFGLSFSLGIESLGRWYFGLDIHRRFPWNFLALNSSLGPLELHIEIKRPEDNQSLEQSKAAQA